MPSKDPRSHWRRAATNRRRDDRRTRTEPFGSSEWVENIKRHYLSWPKLDRRSQNRRRDERRCLDRRQSSVSEPDRFDYHSSPMLLTQEERRLIAEIYRE